MTGYQTVRSFECVSVDAVGIGERLVAIGSGSEITLVSDTDQTAFEHDDSVVDLAINDRIIVLSSEQLSAYDRDGARIWSRSFGDAHAIATLSDIQSIGVLGPETLHIVDAGTGQEQTTVDRDPPGRPDDDQFIGTEHGFVSATWSFLRCITPAGKRTVTYDLDTAIRDIGCVDGVLVAALQNGQLQGFDLQSGDPRWETELSVRQISPNGDGSLLLSTADGIKSITPDGSIDSVGSLTSGSVYADSTGALVCSVNNGTVVTHIPDDELIDIELVTDSVGVGGTIDLDVRNVSDTDQRCTLSGTLAHADLSPSDRRISLDPHESALVDFPVAAVRTDGEADFSVSIDDRVIVQDAIEITDAAGSTLTAEAELQPIEISDGSVTLELSIENTGTVPLESIEILETGAQGTDIAAGETWTNTLTKPYAPGRTITVGLAIVRGNRRTELAPTCRLPAKPSIELDQQRGALQARITADDDVMWADQLVIEAPGAGRVRSPVEMTDGSMLVVVPTYEDGIARVGLAKMDVSQQARVRDTGPVNTLGSRSDHSTDPNRTTASAESASRRGTDRTRSDTDSPAQSGTQRSSGDQRSPPEPDRTAPTPEESTAETGSARSESTTTTTREQSDPDGTEMSIQRQLSDTRPAVGHVVQERLTVRNESDRTVEPIVVVDGERTGLGSLAPGSERSISRRLVFFDSTETTLPEAQLRVGDTTVDRLQSGTVQPVQEGLSVRGAVDSASGAYEIELTNHGTGPIELTRIELGGTQVDDGPTLDAGASTVVTGTGPTAPSGDTVTGSVTLASGERINTVLVSRSLSDDGNEETVFDKRIGSETKVAGEYGTVVLVFENTSADTLSDVRLTADGDIINDILYSPAHRETLAPGDRIEHYVDLKATGGTVDVEFTAEYTLADDHHERTYHATGPAVETEGEWTDDHLDSWTLTGDADSSARGPDLPAQLTTPYTARQNE